MRLDDDLKYFEQPDFKKILAEYEAAREVGIPLYMDAEDLTDIAEYYALVAEDETSSQEVLEFALQLHPDAVDPQIFRARQFMLKGDADKAWELCEAIEDQSHREVCFLRAELLIRANKAKEAFSLLFFLIDTIDEDRDFFIYDSAYIFIDYREFEWAVVFSNKLEEMSPDWYKTWQLQADVALGLEQFRTALSFIERMLDVDPFDVESWNWRAEAYSSLEEYDKAVESTDYALAIEPDNERALQLKAWVLMQQGNTVEANKLYDRLIGTNPDCEQHWLYKSYCTLDAGDAHEALALIKRAEELAGDVSVDQQAIHEQYAQVLSRLGDMEGALLQLDMAEALRDPNLGWDERMLRVRVHAENEDPIGAIIEAQRQLEMYKDVYMKVYYQCALILFEYGYFEQAYYFFNDISSSEAARKVSEQPLEVYSYMAYIDMEQGNDERALENLRKAVDALDPHLSELFEDKFPGVLPNELYDYYYNKVYGRWPED